MAKASQNQSFLNKPWKHVVAAAIAFLLTYVAASWGIDSGRLTAYFLAIVLGVIGIKQTVQAVKMRLL